MNHQAIPVASDDLQRLRDSHSELLTALQGVIPYMEAAETAGLVGDEGCHWPVESARAAIAHALPCYHDDRPDGRPDMHISTGPFDLDCAGRPLRAGS